jgi:hypothetical protein
MLVIVMLVLNDFSDFISKENTSGQVSVKLILTLILAMAIAYLLKYTSMSTKRLAAAIKHEKLENKNRDHGTLNPF